MMLHQHQISVSYNHCVFDFQIASSSNAASIWPHNPCRYPFSSWFACHLQQYRSCATGWGQPIAELNGPRRSVHWLETHSRLKCVYWNENTGQGWAKGCITSLDVFSIHSAKKFEYGWSLIIRGTQRHSTDSMMRPNPGRCVDTACWAKQNRFATKLAFCRTSLLVTIGFASPVLYRGATWHELKYCGILWHGKVKGIR